jgi:hypothetical protein
LYQTLSENLGRHTVSVEQVNQCDDSWNTEFNR